MTYLDAQLPTMIRVGAIKLLGRAGLTPQDLPDLEQELLAFVLRAESKFDPAKASERTYFARVIRNGGSKLLRARQAMKRKQKVTSLDGVGQDGASLGATIAQDVHQARLERSPRSPEELAELELDMDEFIQRLPKRLGKLAEDMKNKSLVQIARELGVPRTTLYGLVAELRGRLEAAGLRGYR